MEENLSTNLNPIKKTKLNITNIIMACLFIVATGAAITFAVLWINEKDKQPVVVNETISSVPSKEDINVAASQIRSLTFDPAKVVNGTSGYSYSAVYNSKAHDNLYGQDGQAIYAVAKAFSPNTVRLHLHWSILGPMYGASAGSGEPEEVDLEFSQEVSQIYISHYGQGVGYERILFLLADGTVEYIPIADAVKNHEFKSYGKLEGLKNIVNFYDGNITAQDGIGSSVMSYAQDIEGNIYLLYSPSLTPSEEQNN